MRFGRTPPIGQRPSFPQLREFGVCCGRLETGFALLAGSSPAIWLRPAATRSRPPASHPEFPWARAIFAPDRRRVRAVPLGMPHDHLRTRLYRPGPELGTREIHQNAAGEREFAPRAREVPDHPRPNLGRIVSTIDPHAIHPMRNQLMHQRVVVGSLRRHRNHDADAAVRRAPGRAALRYWRLAALCPRHNRYIGLRRGSNGRPVR